MIILDPLHSAVSLLFGRISGLRLVDSCGSLDSPSSDDETGFQSPCSKAKNYLKTRNGEYQNEHTLFPASTSLPPCEAWPDFPVLLRTEPGAGMRTQTQDGILRVAEKEYFETEIFKGCIVIRASGLSSSEPGQFGSRKRKLQIVVQGKFKQKVFYSEVYSGQEFARPFTHPPPSWLVSLFITVARTVSPCYKLVGPREPRPGITGLLVGLAQSICVSEPGQEPDPMGIPYEDTDLLGPEFPKDFSSRKKTFSKREGWEDNHFDTTRIWTFGFWEHLMSIADFKLDLGVLNLPAAQYIEDQALVICSKTRDKTLYSVEVWHEIFAKASAEKSEEKSCSPE
uniref:Domain of unknown function at the cortex 1 domain-containing protein n=1 Tax=Tetraselmis sp. GSL018 TaxID=582737 RepID=A0A061R667_9CHLO|mmetsp:Transcript_17016/g.40596  ORF Transcript_17016/g.40596 Transcript_17016/m.40596 type:complete len:340 (+) Transcript_17016:177-1196(+)|eukprot:CAMPEP_0177602068 /NCGR_PEP_ID=MMETSP0419_2-20121207/14657_1 /TAXON_ID=582737 /ORGANISM="Tetraselmis sp., Strain GSL018" /LENGTH=339 /DNA_ID=CAMNT_0019095499 /DNA_START=148 /DNA_END=1167 /DNA_ORIENTATION=+